jgi:hypothetical protein
MCIGSVRTMKVHKAQSIYRKVEPWVMSLSIFKRREKWVEKCDDIIWVNWKMMSSGEPHNRMTSLWRVTIFYIYGKLLKLKSKQRSWSYLSTYIYFDYEQQLCNVYLETYIRAGFEYTIYFSRGGRDNQSELKVVETHNTVVLTTCAFSTYNNFGLGH